MPSVSQPEAGGGRRFCIGGTLFAVGVFAYVSSCLLARRRKLARKPMITQLWVYPVKSCSGMPLQQAELVATGFKYDRQWVVLAKKDLSVLTQCELPRMKLISAVVDEESQELVLSNAPSDGHSRQRQQVKVPLEPPADANIHQISFRVMKGGTVKECSPDAARWLSDFLGTEVILAKVIEPRKAFTSEFHAPVTPDGTTVNMHDYCSLHLITEEGLDAVRAMANDPEINTGRFRANVVVMGAPFPEEDEWQSLMHEQSGISLNTAKLGGRCTIVTVNDSGVRDAERQPTRELARHRGAHYDHVPSMGHMGMFGLDMFHSFSSSSAAAKKEKTEEGGDRFLRVGDSLTVAELRPKMKFEPPSASSEWL